MSRLEGKVAVVTGAARGIGEGIALDLDLVFRLSGIGAEKGGDGWRGSRRS